LTFNFVFDFDVEATGLVASDLLWTVDFEAAKLEASELVSENDFG